MCRVAHAIALLWPIQRNFNCSRSPGTNIFSSVADVFNNIAIPSELWTDRPPFLNLCDPDMFLRSFFCLVMSTERCQVYLLWLRLGSLPFLVPLSHFSTFAPSDVDAPAFVSVLLIFDVMLLTHCVNTTDSLRVDTLASLDFFPGSSPWL